MAARNHRERIKPMTLVEFQARFSNDESCADFLYEKCWPEGWICPRCGEMKAYRIAKRGLWECAACGRQTSVMAGTVLHRSHTPLHLWFLAMFLFVRDKRGLSAVALSGHLGVSQETAWYMLHKLRRAMGEREKLYRLDGFVELCEYFFGAPKEGGSRFDDGTKTAVLVGLSSTEAGRPRHLRMMALTRFDREHIHAAVQQMVAKGATISTCGLRGYLRLPSWGYSHQRKTAFKAPAGPLATWPRVIVSNVRALIGGTYHHIHGKHLHAYLNECDYRFNRRFEPNSLFDHIATAVMACSICTYSDITGKQAPGPAPLGAASS